MQSPEHMFRQDAWLKCIPSDARRDAIGALDAAVLVGLLRARREAAQQPLRPGPPGDVGGV